MDEVHPELEELFERYHQAPDGYAFVPLADACRKLGRIDEALEICEKGIARHPTYVSGHVVRGKCFYDKGDREMSMGTFERVLDLDPNNLVALKFLGMMEAEDGDFELARVHLEQILALDPDNKDVIKTVRMIDEQIEGQHRHAEQAPAEKPAGGSYDGPAAIDLEMRDEFDFGSSKSAGATPVITSDDIETSDELATMTLAEIFASQGYVEKARTIYEELLKKNPENVLVREKLNELPGEIVEIEEDEPATTPQAEDESENETVRFSELDSNGSPEPDKAPGELEHPVGVTTTPTPRRRERQRPAIDEKDSLRRFRRWLGDIGN